MKGINYIVDERGSKIALVIDIKRYSSAIEDFLCGLEAKKRKKESKRDFNRVVSTVLKKKKVRR